MKRTLTIGLTLIVLLSALYAGRAIVAGASIKHLDHSGAQAALPVEVQLVGMDRESAYRSAVTRLSPRGNETALRHRFRDSGTIWDTKKEYVRTFRLYLPERAQDDLEQIRIRIGTTDITTAPPPESDLWRAVEASDTELPAELRPYVSSNATAYDYVPPDEDYAFTILPPFKRLLNYVNDFRVALWSIVWAGLVVVPILFFVEVRRRNPACIERAWPWFLTIVAAITAAATVLRFRDPTRAFAGVVEPLALIAIPLSLSLLILLLLRRPPTSWTLGAGQASGKPRARDTVIIVSIMVAGLLLRVLDLDALTRTDMYNLTSAISLVETGSFSYMRNADLTRAIAGLMELFGRSVEVSKMPMVIAAMLTIPLVYAMGRLVSPSVGFLAAALFAVSPHHVAMAGYVREYPVNLLMGTAVVAVQFFLYRRFSHRRGSFLPMFIGASALMYLLVLGYSEVANNATVRAVLQSAAFVAVPLVLHHIKRHFPKVALPSLLIMLVVVVGAAAVMHKVGPFTSGLRLRPDFFRAYLNPLETQAMQPFSLAAVSLLFTSGLLILPYIGRERNPYLDAALFGFWGTVILFSLKLEAGNADRYVYHVSVLYTLLFAGGLVWLIRSLAAISPGRPAGWFAAAVFLLILVNPVNSVQAAFGIVPNERDVRTPTNLSGGDYYEPVAEFMRENGVVGTVPLIEAAAQPFLVSLLMERPITKQRFAASGVSYDIGENIYPIRMNRLKSIVQSQAFGDDSDTSAPPPKWRENVDESREAFRAHNAGFLITNEYRLLPPRDFVLKDVSFSYLGSVEHPYDSHEGFVLYRWTVEGPEYPDFAAAFSGDPWPILDE